MSVVSISANWHLGLNNSNCNVGILNNEDTYITVLNSQQLVYLNNLKKNVNVLYVSPMAVNRYHGGDSLRQTLVVFEKKCPDQSEPKPALGVSKEVTTPVVTT